MRLRGPALATLLLASALAGCLEIGDDAPAPACAEEGLPDRFASLESPDAVHVHMNTSRGDIVAELYHEKVPITVANFVRYAHEGFYEGLLFHRVVPGFVVQTGGFDANLTERETHDPIPLETHPDLDNERGTLSMARTNDPHSATSQFYVNLDHNENLDGPGGYAVFGEVVEGMDTVDAIADVPTGERDGREDVPEEDVLVRCTSLSLPTRVAAPEAPGLAVAGFLDEVNPPEGEATLVPFQVVNAWDQPREVRLEPVGAAADVRVPMAEDGALNLTPGGSALALAEVPAGTGNATAGVEVPAADGTWSVNATAEVRPANGTGPAADTENHTRVDVRFVGVFRTGAPFGTNIPAVHDREDLRTLPGPGHEDVFRVWTGDGQDPDGLYSSVPPGFRDVILGLREDQSRLEAVAPEDSYRDGVTRWLHFAVEAVKER